MTEIIEKIKCLEKKFLNNPSFKTLLIKKKYPNFLFDNNSINTYPFGAINL